jgi:hypothetical protein
MVCLGTPQGAPAPLESEAAHLFALQAFRADFLSRYPTGMVISELEYLGGTTSAPSAPTPLRVPSKPAINRILDALAEDFRNWTRNRDYRKCDGLGLANDGRYAELLEVTTVDNARSAIRQMAEKLAILRGVVNRIHSMSVDWRPTAWTPRPNQLFLPLPTGGTAQLRYVCFGATYRLPAPGIALYEMHVIERPRVPVPVEVPDGVREPIREAWRRRPVNQREAEPWAERFAREHPVVMMGLRALAAIAGVAAAVAAVILIFDPLPGDEAAAGAAAAALLRFATA